MTIAVDAPAAGAAPARPARRLLARLVAVGVLAGTALLAVSSAADIQVIEAAASRPVVALFLGSAVHVPGSDMVFYPNYAGPGYRSLQITAVCSSPPLVIPLLVLGALAALQRRFSPVRATVVTLSLVAAIFVINIGRIVMICVATRHWGQSGYELTHRVVGSVLIMAALASSFVIGARLLSGSVRRGRPSVRGTGA